MSIGQTLSLLQAIAGHTLGVLLSRRRVLFVLVIAGLPVLLAGVTHAVDFLFGTGLPSTQAAFGVLAQSYYFAAVLLVTMTLGSGLINDEVENRTLAYLLTRPVARPLVVVGKYLALLVVGLLLLPGSMVATYLMLAAPQSGLREGLGLLADELLWMALAVPAYGAAFTLVGVIARRPVNVAAAFVFLWELPFAFLPLLTRKLTITHYLLSISPQSSKLNALVDLLGMRSSMLSSVLMLVGFSLLYLGLAAVVFQRRQYVLSSSS